MKTGGIDIRVRLLEALAETVENVLMKLNLRIDFRFGKMGSIWRLSCHQDCSTNADD